MIYERFTFIFLCFILSCFTSYRSSAAELKVLNSNSAIETASLNSGSIAKDHGVTKYSQENCCQTENSVELSPGYQLVQNGIKTEEKQQKNTVNSISDVESTPAINRRLLLGAIALTSAIYLLLVRILFKKPTQKQDSLAIVPTTIKPENSLAGENAIVRSESHAATDLSQEITLAHQAQGNLDLVARHKTLAENSAEDEIVIAQKNSPTINIDVVSELIKDLQPLDNSGDLADSFRCLRSSQAQRDLRRKAIWALAEIGDHRCIEPLAKMMSQADSLDRSLISRTITQITNRSFKSINERLFSLLEDKNPEVRKIAIRDLTTLGKFTSAIATRLEQMQSDPDNEVKVAAIKALEELDFSYFASTINSYSSNKISSLALDQKGKANLYLVTHADKDPKEADLER